MIDDEIRKAATRVLDACKSRELMIATAESCTGGLVGAALTEIAGSSAVVDRGFITYSNAAKNALLGVSNETLKDHGEVSRETAEAMARGALANSDADLSVAVTGIAGPGGGSDKKPIGLVHFAAADSNGALLHSEHRYGDIGRAQVRRQSVFQALSMLLTLAERRKV